MMSTSPGDQPTAVTADNTQLGITVLSLFGVAWTVALLPLPSGTTPVALTAMAIAIPWAGIVLLTARRRDFSAAEASAAAASDLSASQRQRIFLITNVAQAVIFSVAISICIATGRIDWIPLIAALIVGLHFIPLARAFGESSFGRAGAALAALGGVGFILVLLNATTLEVAVTSTAAGSAITLLSTATTMLIRHGRRFEVSSGIQH